MATTSPVHTGAPLSRRTRLRLPVAGLAAAAVVAVLLPAGIGSAAPSSHLTLGQVKSQIAVLNSKAERVAEAYDNAHDQLTALQRKEKATDRQLRHDVAQLAKVRAKLAKSAVAAYRTGGLSATASLLSSGSPQTFLDQTSSLEQIARYQRSQIALADSAQRVTSAAKLVHAAQVAQQKKTVSSIASERSQINGLLQQRKAVLSRLTAAARRTYQAQVVAATQHAVAERHTYNGPATGQAAAAVRFAYAQLGKPYVYGGAGPDSYDCSGLTMRAWEAAGVSLPHNAAAQQADIPAVSLSDLEPGDLVFFGDPAYHVAIYIGGGNIIQAPHTGASVEITPLAYMPPSGAGRP